MAKKQSAPSRGSSKTTTVPIDKSRTLTNKNGNFSVKQDGKTVKPTSQDTAMYNAAAKSNNQMQKVFKKPLLADTLKKKK